MKDCGTGSTYRVKVFSPVLVRLNNDLDGDVGAILLEELAEHLAL